MLRTERGSRERVGVGWGVDKQIETKPLAGGGVGGGRVLYNMKQRELSEGSVGYNSKQGEVREG